MVLSWMGRCQVQVVLSFALWREKSQLVLTSIGQAELAQNRHDLVFGGMSLPIAALFMSATV